MKLFLFGLFCLIGGISTISTGAIGGKMPGVIIGIGEAKYFIGGVWIIFGLYTMVQPILMWRKKWLDRKRK